MPLSRFVWPLNETIKTWTQVLAISSNKLFMQQCWLLWGPGQYGQVLQLYTVSWTVFGWQWCPQPNHHLDKHLIVKHFGKVLKTWRNYGALLKPRTGLGWALYGASSGSTGVICFFFFPVTAVRPSWNQGSLVLYKHRSHFLLFCAWCVDFCKTNTEKQKTTSLFPEMSENWNLLQV